MARRNINQRRAKISAYLETGIPITTSIKRELAVEFTCSVSAIGQDINYLTFGAGLYPNPTQRRRIFERDHNTCQYCGLTDRPNMILEHVIPQSQGGVAKDYNLVAACASCNVKKRGQVWIPLNIDLITASNRAWRERILELAAR